MHKIEVAQPAGKLQLVSSEFCNLNDLLDTAS